VKRDDDKTIDGASVLRNRPKDRDVVVVMGRSSHPATPSAFRRRFLARQETTSRWARAQSVPPTGSGELEVD
jgi:hypothetical protein